VAVKIRLSRMGRKKRPFYRIVAIDSRKRRDGEYIEKLGHYDPITRPATLVVDHDKAVKWLKEGAIVSDTVRSLFKRDGVMLRWDMTKREYEQVKIEEAVKAHRDHRLAKLEAKDKPAEKPAPKAEAKPEPKEEKPAAKAEKKAEPKEEVKVEAKEEPKAEVKKEAKEEPKAEPKAEAKDEAKPAKEEAAAAEAPEADK